MRTRGSASLPMERATGAIGGEKAFRAHRPCGRWGREWNRNAPEIFSNHWKTAGNFFQSLEKTVGFFQPLEKSFPTIGKNGPVFPTIGKFFSNHWKTGGGRFRGGGGLGAKGGCKTGRGDYTASSSLSFPDRCDRSPILLPNTKTKSGAGVRSSMDWPEEAGPASGRQAPTL